MGERGAAEECFYSCKQAGMSPILSRGKDGVLERKRERACLRVTRPTALSSLIPNHEPAVHDTLPCSARIPLFTVSTEIRQARLLSLNSLGQMGVCRHLPLRPCLSLQLFPFKLTNSADYKRINASARGGLWRGSSMQREQCA